MNKTGLLKMLAEFDNYDNGELGDQARYVIEEVKKGNLELGLQWLGDDANTSGGIIKRIADLIAKHAEEYGLCDSEIMTILEDVRDHCNGELKRLSGASL